MEWWSGCRGIVIDIMMRLIGREGKGREGEGREGDGGEGRGGE